MDVLKRYSSKSACLLELGSLLMLAHVCMRMLDHACSYLLMLAHACSSLFMLAQACSCLFMFARVCSCLLRFACSCLLILAHACSCLLMLAHACSCLHQLVHASSCMLVYACLFMLSQACSCLLMFPRLHMPAQCWLMLALSCSCVCIKSLNRSNGSRLQSMTYNNSTIFPSVIPNNHVIIHIPPTCHVMAHRPLSDMVGVVDLVGFGVDDPSSDVPDVGDGKDDALGAFRPSCSASSL